MNMKINVLIKIKKDERVIQRILENVEEISQRIVKIENEKNI